MLTEQGGLCAVCRSNPVEHVDLDHETGAVRALLCLTCNGGLGQFKDDPGLLRLGALYVEHHRQQHASALLQAAGSDDPDGSADVTARR